MTSSSSVSHNSICHEKIQVLYESDRVLAIYKPSGIAHHGGGASVVAEGHDEHEQGKDEDEGEVKDEEESELGILQLLRRQRQAQQGDDIASNSSNERLFGVHRLDRVTSGILLFAKTAETAKLLTRLFREKQVIKYYVGLSGKKPLQKKQGWVKGNMVRSRRKSWKLTRRPSGEAQQSRHDDTEKLKAIDNNFAVTRFITCNLSRFRNNLLRSNLESTEQHHQQDPHSSRRSNGDSSAAFPKTLILFQPHTGKTHQLRVAAKSVGLALFGDPIYGDGSAEAGQRRQQLQRSSCCLHAAGLHVRLDDKETITIWCPPTRIFQQFWDSEGVTFVEESLSELLEQHCNSDELLALAAIKTKQSQ